MPLTKPANMSDLKCAGQTTLVRIARAFECGWYRWRSSSVKPSWKERAADLDEQSTGGQTESIKRGLAELCPSAHTGHAGGSLDVGDRRCDGL